MTITINDIVNLSDQDIRNMSTSELQKYVKKAGEYSSERRRRAIDAIIKDNLPIPTAYKDWGVKPEFTSKGERTKWKGYAEYKSYLDVPMAGNIIVVEDGKYITKKTDREVVGSLREQLAVYSRFLSTKTSTKEGWEKNLSKFRSRLKKKTNIKITQDNFNEFWRIYGALIEANTVGTSFTYVTVQERVVSELQDMIWSEMSKKGQRFNQKFEEDISIDQDAYAQLIMNKITNRITSNYEQRQEEEMKRDNEVNKEIKGRIKLTSRGYNE